MREVRHGLIGMAASWLMMMDLPRPEESSSGSRPGARVAGRRILGWFPILAAVNGMLLAFSGLLVGVLSNRFAGAAAFAVLTFAYMAVRHSGRGWVVLTSWLLNLRDGGGFSGALAQASADRSELDRDWAAAVLTVLAILTLLILFLIGLFGSRCFVALVLAGSAAVRGELMTALPPEEGGIHDPRCFGRLVMWILTAAFGVIGAWFHPVATALCAAAVLLAVWRIGVRRGAEPGLNLNEALWIEAATEAALLISCFLWTVR